MLIYEPLHLLLNIFPRGISVLWPSNFRTNPAFVTHQSAYRFTHLSDQCWVCLWTTIMVWTRFIFIQENWGRVGHQFGSRYYIEIYSKGKCKLIHEDWTTRASKQPNHTSNMCQIGHRKTKMPKYKATIVSPPRIIQIFLHTQITLSMVSLSIVHSK